MSLNVDIKISVFKFAYQANLKTIISMWHEINAINCNSKNVTCNNNILYIFF